jgi:hypothetical protein
MIFPVEIILMIAYNLDATDLRSFRLADRKLAKICAPLIARNGISIMNTTEGLKDLQQFLQLGEIADTTKQLKLYFGDWPICIRPCDWKSHPLLYGHSISNKVLLRTQGREHADKAFTAYSKFIAENRNRDFQEDVNVIFKALVSLRNLNSIVISHMQSWAWDPPQLERYQKLQKKIWMAPCTTNEVAAGVQTFLLAFGSGLDNKNLKDLTIKGAFDPAHVFLSSATSCFRGIRRLCINSFKIQQNQDTIQNFLHSFPDLAYLSISFQGWDYYEGWGHEYPQLFKDAFWPKLETLSVNDLWISEEELFGIIKNHHKGLRSFIIGNAALTSGSWRSFFTRMRRLDTMIKVMVKGELFGRTCEDLLDLSQDVFHCIFTEFMKDKDSEWPFGKEL